MQNVTEEAFTILVLDQAALESVSGVAKHRREFNSAILILSIIASIN